MVTYHGVSDRTNLERDCRMRIYVCKLVKREIVLQPRSGISFSPYSMKAQKISLINTARMEQYLWSVKTPDPVSFLLLNFHT